MKTVYLLGADDPEMCTIEKILKKIRVSVAYASIDNTRVHPGNAYWANSVQGIGSEDTLVCIECRPTFIPKGVKVITIDHHRPGDPGYNLGPDKFWEASSIGQLHKLLNIKPTDGVKIIAAMDHCFSAALRDECPEVFGLEVLLVGVAEVATRTKTGHGRVIQQIHHISGLLGKAPEIMIGEQTVKDLRSRYLGEGYSLDLIAAQIASAMRGHAALLRHRSLGGGPEKCSVTGHTRPETIEAFMSEWAPSQGLVRIYGVPQRGYAGGYVS